MYFMDKFSNLVSAKRDAECIASESLGRNLAVQTRTLKEVLAYATWLSHHDVLHNKELQGLSLRKAAAGYRTKSHDTGNVRPRRPDGNFEVRKRAADIFVRRLILEVVERKASEVLSLRVRDFENDASDFGKEAPQLSSPMTIQDWMKDRNDTDCFT